MFKLFKILLKGLWRLKKIVSLCMALVLLIFIIRFPWNHFIEKIARKLQQKASTSVQFDFDKIKVHPIPPGIEFKDFVFYHKQKALTFDSLTVLVDLGRWLSFRKALRLEILKKESLLSLVFWKKQKTLEEGLSVDLFFIKGYSPSLSLEVFNSFLPETKISGSLNLRFDYEGHPDRVSTSKAMLKVKGQDIALTQIELKTPIGPLSLPSISWKKASADFSLKEGELIFNEVLLGGPSDQVIVRMKGSGSLKNFRLKAYDIQLQIDLDKNFKMSLLDLMFAGFKEDKGDFYRYSLRITGQGSEPPDMEKLLEF